MGGEDEMNSFKCAVWAVLCCRFVVLWPVWYAELDQTPGVVSAVLVRDMPIWLMLVTSCDSNQT